MDIIPHRHPFLLVDTIEELVPGVRAAGKKCVTYDEYYFRGHFPQEPVMPGVLIIEALAQVGAVCILSCEKFKGKTAYFGGINNCRFKKKVVPGDVLMLETELIKQKGPVAIARATATVDGKVAATAELTVAIEMEFKFRFAPNEKFYQTKGQRYPITKDAPVFTLSHVVGLKGVFDSKYNYNRTDFSVRKAFWFSAFGHLNVMLQAGKVWNKVPYPMLIIPNANLSYLIQQGSYSLMNPMEFINDSYASWDLTYFANGILFNRIPLVKYMKLREVISFKGMFGHLSDKNNPALHPDSDFLWAFPSTTRMMDKKTPYMEFGAGLDNIFTILRVEYVRFV